MGKLLYFTNAISTSYLNMGGGILFVISLTWWLLPISSFAITSAFELIYNQHFILLTSIWEKWMISRMIMELHPQAHRKLLEVWQVALVFYVLEVQLLIQRCLVHAACVRHRCGRTEQIHFVVRYVVAGDRSSIENLQRWTRKLWDLSDFSNC